MAERAAKRDDRNQSKEVVRFRRWIAMTPDSKWREFRGTADMVDVGRGANLVELVDEMMGSRIELYTQFLDGWKTMRSGLSEENATWIFSEMISGMESLKKFEIENFSKKNKWAAPKKREAFPRYLSDRPVKDGSLTVGAKPMFELDKQIEMICGPSFPKALVSELKLKMNIADIARTSKKRRFGQDVNGSGNEPTSNAVERNRSRSQQPTTSSNRMVTIREMDVALKETSLLGKTEVQRDRGVMTNSVSAESRSRSRRMCSGFGLMFDGNGQTRITVSRTSSFDGGRLRMIPNKTEVPQQPSEFLPALRNVVQNESTNDQPKLMGILVTRNEKGEYIPIGLAPLTVSQLTSGNRQILQNVVLKESVTELELVPDSRGIKSSNTAELASVSRVDPNRLEDDRMSTNAVCSGSTTSDSGLSSTSEQGHASTRSSSPGSKISPLLSEKTKNGKPDIQNSGLSSPSGQSHVSTRSSSPGTKNCSSRNEKIDNHNTESSSSYEHHQNTTTLPQSYASVVSNQATRENDRTNPRAHAVASSSSTTVVMAANLLGDEKEEETLVMSSRKGNIGRKPSDDSWIVVKPKNPLETNESSFSTSTSDSRLCEPSTSYAVSKNYRIEKANALNDVAENWDNVVVDEQAEKEHELKRLKKQSHRAAKFKKEKEEKKALRAEQSRQSRLVVQENLMAAGEEPIIEEHQSENTVRTVALYAPLTSNSNLMSLIEAQEISKEEEEQQGTYDPVTQQYSDGHIFHEYEDEIETGNNRKPKDLIFETSELHAKLVFRLLWFENNKKLDKCIVDDATRTRLRDSLSMVRTMKDRIDMAGQMLVWRITHINLSSMKEVNIVSIIRNLIDVQRQHFENDLMMARTMGDLVDEGKLVKNFVYEKHVYTILKLPELLVPKLKKGNANARTYQDITTLVLLFTKRVEKLYEEFGKLYEFKVVKDRQRGRRGY